MLNNKFSFNNFLSKSKKFNVNLRKAEIAFQSLKSDYYEGKIPMLESYDKDYEFNFSSKIVKKFNKYKNIVIIGMGGSILGTKSIYSFLKKKIRKKIFFFDNLDSNLHLEFEKIKNLNNSCFIIVSKSGNTLETITNLGIVLSKRILKNKLVFITEIVDSSLMTLANRYSAEIIEHKEFIGGRYSVLSESGMFPTTLMGLNIKKFKNLKKLINNKSFVSALIKNVASIYTLNAKGIKNAVILNYDSNLNDTANWYQQLVAESLGKKGKGITPILSYAPKDHHSLLQLFLDGPKDKFFTFFNSSGKRDKYKISNDIVARDMKFLKNKSLEYVIQAQYKATKNIFKLNKMPFRCIVFSSHNEDELGMFFTFFVLETILLSRLMNVNPFDQPAIEQVKIETRKFLS